jgi:hypothetical protein
MKRNCGETKRKDVVRISEDGSRTLSISDVP